MPKRNKDLSSEIGKRIRKKRKDMRLTQDELASRSGLTTQFLAAVERGEKGMGAESIVRVSFALGTTTDYLLTGSITQQEQDYINRLFGIMDDSQRRAAITVLQNILIIGGHSPPES